MEIIRPALQHPAGSAARRLAVDEAARKVHIHPSGRRARVSRSAIYGWIAAHESGGLGAVARKRRSDAGRPRHHVTAAWDAAMSAHLDASAMAETADGIDRYVRSLWAATTEPGWRWVARLASDELMARTRAAGYQGSDRELRRICKLSKRFVERGRPWRAVAIYDQDAKKWHDKDMPRIRRTRAGRRPMEIVVCDVHPMDVLLPRGDGSTFTPRLVCFQDWATNRIFIHPVFPEKGQDVRQEDVVEGFMAMALHPEWGMPEKLYLDHGKEYGHMELLSGALQLATETRLLLDDPTFHRELTAGRGAIVWAQPYNAPAKSIEPAFNVLEKSVFSMLQGWIGGNRMTKKTANVGRAPEPYPHGKDAFLVDLEAAVAAYETHPQSGVLEGRSPREAYTEAVTAGWRRMDVTRGALLAAFARDESRVVHQGGFSYKSRRYTAPAIQALPAGRRLHLRVPIWGDLSEIAVMGDDGELMCIATVDRPYDALDPEGAKESGRRRAVARAGIASLRAETDPLDMREVLAKTAANAESAPIPASAGRPIEPSDGMKAVAAAFEFTPDERRATDEESEQVSRKRTRELRHRLLQKRRATG